MEIQIELTMPFGADDTRLHRLFGHVRGGIVAREGVLRVQQADRDDVQRRW